VTVCTQGKVHLLDPHPVRQMVQDTWNDLGSRFNDIQLDEFIIMPNHVHFIVWITVGAPPRGCPNGVRLRVGTGTRPYTSLFDIIYWFKSMTTNEYIHGVKNNGWPSFPGRLWQRNYYERVIRDEDELMALREYIQYNPRDWDTDPENIAT